MDIPGLKAELEEHLKRNPHPEAPEGFRDRFEQAAEHYQAETDADDKAQLATLLQRIPKEAEAAANAACASDEPDLPEPREPIVGDPLPSGPDGDPRPDGRRSRTRIGVIVGALAAAAAAAFYFYSGSS
jgi:hypothetical protein